MSQDSPSWIDKDYIRKCIQGGGENRQILVKSLEITPAVPPGNNYGSNIWRVKVKYLEKPAEDIQDLFLIVKAPLEDENVTGILEEVLQIEPGFYNKILPRLIDNSFAPKPFFSAVPDAVVMEDLIAQGYLMADRLKGLDFDHCRLYAMASATFHAATVAAYKKIPQLFELLGKEKVYTSGLDNGLSKGFKRLTSIAVCCMAKEMENIDEFKSYADLVRICADSLWDEVVEVHKRSQTLNVLGQGDPWTTNMMFKYNSSGKVDGIKLLDFQVLRYSSPVADLVFFIWTSASHEVREHHLEDLYHLYCDTLNDKLQQFNCPERLPYDELISTIKRFYPLILDIAAFYEPIIRNPEGFDFGPIMKKAIDGKVPDDVLFEMFSKYYTETYCDKELTKTLNELKSIGLFQLLKSNREEDKRSFQK